MKNNWLSGSKTLQFPDKLGRIVEDSVSAKFVTFVMSVWDRLISGSVVVSWFTGHELGWKPIAGKRGLFGNLSYSLWIKFLGFIQILFGENSSFQKSFFVTLAKGISGFVVELPFVASGIFGAGFFGTWGILKMAVLGVSYKEIIVIITCFIMSVLIMFIRVSVKGLLEGSWFMAKLQEIDD